MGLFGAAEQFEGTLVDGAFAHLAIETRHGFGVVVEDVGLYGEDGVERVPLAAKIGNENFNFAARNAAANFRDGAGEDGGAAVGLVIAIDAGDYGITKAHAGDRFGDAVRLLFIRRADRFAGRNGAEAAGTSANVAEDHKSRCAVFPAFTHVGAACGFADRVEIESAHDALEVLIAFAAEEADAKPVRARMIAGRSNGGRVGIGDDVER